MNFSILKHHPSTYGSQLHWFAQRCTIYKFKMEFWILLKISIKMFINVHHQTIQTPSPKQKRHQRRNTKPSPTHHQNITAPSPHITETSPKHARDITNTSLKDPQNTTKKTTPKQHRDITKKKTETRPRQDQDKTETSPRHDRDITETTPKQHRDITKKRQRQDRDTTESTNFSILKPSPSTYGHSYPGWPKGAQYTNSNWNLRFCLETRSKCSLMFITKQSKHHHQRNKNSTATSTRQHQAITHSSS